MKLLDGFFTTAHSREASRPARLCDVQAITDTIQSALASAGLNTPTDRRHGVTDTIQRALSAAGLIPGPAAPSQNGLTIEGVCRESSVPDGSRHDAAVAPGVPAEHVQRGEFLTRSFSNSAGTRMYKLYVPASYWNELDELVPLVVMLHGCTQSPDDFAAGTRMNAFAEQHGFLVVYPAQAPNANRSKCWNWFRPEDQRRDGGEPSLIAGITSEVASNYGIDGRRIFVAGLSAGAAMAVVLGATYPELYAAVGAHSGLPYGAAYDVPSAFRAMKSGEGIADVSRLSAAATVRDPQCGVPTIVFHGDCDHTVNARNSAAIVEQATVRRSGEQPLQVSMAEGTTLGGRKYSRTIFADTVDRPVVEHWVLHGTGHAWSGGGPEGSFTDVCGPDASAEMIRFFYSQRGGIA